PLNVALIAPYVFDASVKQIFASLLRGNCLYIVPEEYRNIGEKLTEYYIENSIDISDGTPSHFKLILGDNIEKIKDIPVKHFIIGGEELSVNVVKDFLAFFKDKKPNITNIYGPTECCVDSTAFLIDSDRLDTLNTIPIGRPLVNYNTYIVDKDNKLQPIGVAGELCIAGAGLARGYLNKPEMTEEKFVANPFEPGKKMYKTGDLARWLPDGNIEFLGRIDYQVKIRGYRIELGEIENQLLKNEGIKEAVVIDKQDGQGNKYLCAYIVSDREITVSELRKNLSQSLPDYMIPTYFVQIEKIPLTLNGKINRKALPEPDGSINTGIEYVAATNDIEKKLVKIWSNVLEVDNIGINDDFFTLGGHSLKAIKIVSIIQKELMVEISVGDIFSNLTIRQLGEYIGKTKEIVYSSIEAVEERELYEVSSAQKRMFALNQFSKKETNYNIPHVIIFEGKLEKSKLEESFKKLIERHEAFRTSFELANNEIMQRIHKAVQFNLEYEEVNTSSEDIIKSKVEKFIKPFDLSKAPLLRVKLIRLEEEKYVLMFDMHHIISDGTSMDIIMDEFTKLFKNENLEELRVQYKDYSAWENRMLASEGMKKHEEYWTKMFSDEIPVLNSQTDYPRPSIQSFEGESIGFGLDKDLTQKLNKISKAKVATLYMTLLSAYNILLSKYSGQEDIVVGSPIAGRSHAELYNMVGMFVNTLAMRNYPGRKKTFNEFLQEVKKNALSAYENQGYQFDKLVEKLDIKRDLSRNALFDTMFTLQNTENKEMELDKVRIKQFQFERGVSKFDITLSAEEKGEEIKFNLEYCTKLFKRETIERMIEHFKNILKAVAEEPEIKLCEIDMLSEEEKREILVAFNNTKTQYPKDKTICEYFEEQVRNTPDNAAVAYEGKKLTYKELNEKANQLARVLRGKGVKTDTIVGIMVERSLEMMVGIMGILKAGGAYLPISPEYPDDRI
ncbi:MAG: condensation domain-containing protein, partial [Lutisporaceae bacterium]